MEKLFDLTSIIWLITVQYIQIRSAVDHVTQKENVDQSQGLEGMTRGKLLGGTSQLLYRAKKALTKIWKPLWIFWSRDLF